MSCVSGIENLPCELQRNFQLMRELDQRTEGGSRPFSKASSGSDSQEGWHQSPRDPVHWGLGLALSFGH